MEQGGGRQLDVVGAPASRCVLKASIDVVASSAGTARIVAAGGYDAAILTIGVVPAGERPRWPSHLAVQPDTNGRWSVRVVDRAADGGLATGSVALTEGGRTLGVKQLDSGQTVVPLPSLPIGQHEITATYGGDVNFFPSSQSVAFTIERMWIGSFTSAVRRIDDTTAELRIAANGIEGIVPTSTRRSSTGRSSPPCRSRRACTPCRCRTPATRTTTPPRPRSR